MELCSRGEKLGSTPNWVWATQDARWRSVDRRLPRGNREARGMVARPDLTGLLLKAH